MKKVLVLTMVLCCLCAHTAWGYNERVGSFGASAPYARMTTTSSSLISMQGHERIAGACHTSFSNAYIPSDETSSSGPQGHIRKVGHDKPNEPGDPIGDGLPVLLFFALAFLCYKKMTQKTP